MNYNFTERVRKVLSMARQEAIRLQHDYVGTEHILLGLIREGEGVAAQFWATSTSIWTRCTSAWTSPSAGERRPLHSANCHTPTPPRRCWSSPWPRRASSVTRMWEPNIFFSAFCARARDRRAGPEFAGCDDRRSARGDSEGAGPRRELRKCDGEGGRSESGVPAPAPGPGPQRGDKKSKTPALDHFCRDLTGLARQGELDPIIGRTGEIERVVEILCGGRRTTRC